MTVPFESILRRILYDRCSEFLQSVSALFIFSNRCKAVAFTLFSALFKRDILHISRPSVIQFSTDLLGAEFWRAVCSKLKKIIVFVRAGEISNGPIYVSVCSSKLQAIKVVKREDSFAMLIWDKQTRGVRCRA